ncbi:MAG: DUF2723 domain-containing protein, partial [Phycisphaerae bacterium]|nr:DUF2723 domain-containing protein [Phycisphaerae bacterium]
VGHLIPIGPIAYWANMFSAVCGAAAAVVTYAAARELGISKPVAAAAGLVWVWSRWSWSQSVITEVYALNSLLTVAVLWCGLRWYRTRSYKPLVAASVLMGLGMCNHHVIALAGLAVVAWIVLLEPRLVLRWRLVLGCISMFAVGLLPYAYLPIRAKAQPPINWGDPSTPQRFREHVTRAHYGAIGPMKVADPRSLKRLGPQVGYLAQSLGDDMTWWLAGAGLVGLVGLAWWDRRILLLLLLWLACTGLLFALLANYDADRTSRWVMRVFLIPVPLGLAISLAFLLERLCGLVKRRLGDKRLTARAVVVVLIVAAPVVQVAAHWRQCDYSDYWYAHDHARNLLSYMVHDAMVFPSGDHTSFPLVYLVMVEGRRPDVLVADIYGYVNPALYKNRPQDSPLSPAAWVITHSHRPVYYNTKRPPPVDNVRFAPAGLLYHLLPANTEMHHVGLLQDTDYVNLELPTVVDFGASHIMVDFEFFRGLADLQRGDKDAALEHLSRAAQFGAGIKEVYNNIGSALGEYGHPEQAITYFQQAARLDSRYKTPRFNLFRTFQNQGRRQESRAQLEEILAADPDDCRAYRELGFLLYYQGHDLRQAAHFWQESLRRNPAQPQVVCALADYYRQVLHPPARHPAATKTIGGEDRGN